MPKWAMPAHTGHAKVGHDAVYENTDCETTIYVSYQTHWLLLTLKGVYVVKAKACSLCCVLNGHKQHT